MPMSYQYLINNCLHTLAPFIWRSIKWGKKQTQIRGGPFTEFWEVLVMVFYCCNRYLIFGTETTVSRQYIYIYDFITHNSRDETYHLYSMVATRPLIVPEVITTGEGRASDRLGSDNNVVFASSCHKGQLLHCREWNLFVCVSGKGWKQVLNSQKIMFEDVKNHIYSSR